MSIIPSDDIRFLKEKLGSFVQELGPSPHIFITGGTGFFGKWLLAGLSCLLQDQPNEFRTTILSRNPRAFLASHPHFAEVPGFHFIEGDVINFDAGGENITHVIHAATPASATLNLARPEEMLEIILGGTRSILKLTSQNPVRRLLFTSSGAVYGPQPESINHIPENYFGAPDPTAFSSAYGEGKRVSELQLCLDAHKHNYDAVIARCFAFVGPYLPLDGTYAIGNFLRDALSGQDIIIQGDGRTVRSYMYAADLVVWLLTLLVKGKPSQAYNVGSPEALSLREVADRVVSATGTQSQVRVMKPPQPGPANRYVPDTHRAQEELGLKASVDLDTAIRRTFEWNRSLST